MKKLLIRMCGVLCCRQVRHACAVSEDLLGAIVALFFAHVLPDGHHVDFKALAASPDFPSFESSAELRYPHPFSTHNTT